MLDIGFQELVVIFAVAIMVFGPKRLPELSRTLGRSVGQLKKAIFDVKYEINREMKILDEEAGVKNPVKEIPKWKKEALDAIYSGREPRPGGAQGPGEAPDGVNPQPVHEDSGHMDGPHRAEGLSSGPEDSSADPEAGEGQDREDGAA